MSFLRWNPWFAAGFGMVLMGLLAGESSPGPLVWAQTQPAAKKFVIVPGVRVGDITAQTTRDDLVRLYGKHNVSGEEIAGAEGEMYPGVILFPHDRHKQLALFWKDAANKRYPGTIRISGIATVWKTENGITLGTSLKKLEKLNGRPFILYGFGWDFGGEVTSFEKGNLDRFRLGLRFEPHDKTPEKDLYAVSGEELFSSSHPVLQKMNPKVSEITCFF